MSKKPTDNTYHIAFDTKEFPGAVLAVRVTLDQELIRDLDRRLHINLCEHPLYAKLATYVANNPPRVQKEREDV